MMAEIKAKFSVIGISEMWLQDISHTVDINGYNFVHNHRSDRTGGGVGLYKTSELVYKTAGWKNVIATFFVNYFSYL